MMVMVSASSAAYPAVIRYVFDAFAGEIGNLIWQVPLLIIGVASIKGVSMYFQVRQVNELALVVTTSIQKAMSAHLINADLVLVMSAPAGEFVSRVMNDVLIVREAIIRLANNLIRDTMTIITMVAIMMWFDWLLTLVILGVYPLALQPIIAIGRRQRKQSSHLQEQMADVTALLSETLHASRMTRAYSLEAHEIHRTETAFDDLFQRLFYLMLGRARIDPMLEVLGGIAVAGVIAVAGWRVAEGQIQVGDVAGFVTALLLLVQPVRGLGTLNAVVQESAAALNRIFTLLATERQINDPIQPTAMGDFSGTLRFDEVGFSYDAEHALDGISFTANRGQVTAIVGSSGAGKTTALNLIPRLFDRNSGEITLDGIDIASMSLVDLRRLMALVSQDAVLLNDTIGNNIRLGRLDARDDEIKAAARDAAAHDFIIDQPHGYDTMVGEDGGRLSGGQRQRIAIARAMLRDAPILLLDEATSALDAKSEGQIKQALEKLAAGRTTIVVAHRLATVQGADQILVMDGGRIVERGHHAELMKKDGLYARLCSLQHFST
jgi:subfamily B ATP-binding cassette protein MsbA